VARTYFDSSVLLTVLLAEPRAEEASKVWLESEAKVSSILLEAECLNAIRRYASSIGKKIPAGWVEERVAFMGESLADLTAKHVDGEVLSAIRSESALSDCRTLDAIHLATALYFRAKGDDELRLASFDVKMRETARKLGFKLLPA
jgi:predicted nucleic acid-binding protein